jgi:hypothetical protein
MDAPQCMATAKNAPHTSAGAPQSPRRPHTCQAVPGSARWAGRPALPAAHQRWRGAGLTRLGAGTARGSAQVRFQQAAPPAQGAGQLTRHGQLLRGRSRGGGGHHHYWQVQPRGELDGAGGARHLPRCHSCWAQRGGSHRGSASGRGGGGEGGRGRVGPAVRAWGACMERWVRWQQGSPGRSLLTPSADRPGLHG